MNLENSTGMEWQSMRLKPGAEVILFGNERHPTTREIVVRVPKAIYDLIALNRLEIPESLLIHVLTLNNTSLEVDPKFLGVIPEEPEPI